MKALLTIPDEGGRNPLFGTARVTLIDRPFVRHVIEFIVDQGIRKIDLIGPSAGSMRSILGDGCRWGAQISYQDCIADCLASDEDLVLLAKADSLPAFPLKKLLASQTEALVCRPDLSWTGWAVFGGQRSNEISRMSSAGELQDFLEAAGCFRLTADRELRCGTPKLLWQAHQDAIEADLTGLFYTGRTMRPGVWVGRNASLHPSVTLRPPVYIGENSRIGKSASVGPCSVVGSDCVISSDTAVQHSVVLEGTYVGRDLELDHMVAQRGSLFDARSEFFLERVDSSLLGGLFDFPIRETLGAKLGYNRWMMTYLKQNFLFFCKLAWAIWAVAVIVGSLLPGPMLPAAPVGDKVEHFTAYFGLCVLPPLFLSVRRQILWSPVVMILLSISLEIAQTQIPGRTFDLYDIRANMIGATVGFVAGLAIEKLIGGAKKDNRLLTRAAQ